MTAPAPAPRTLGASGPAVFPIALGCGLARVAAVPAQAVAAARDGAHPVQHLDSGR